MIHLDDAASSASVGRCQGTFMPASPQRPEIEAARESGVTVDALAAEVLAQVAARLEDARALPDPEYIDLMRDAALKGGATSSAQIVDTMLDAGISREDIADIYIPRVARDLGEMWCDDTISFSKTTIGSSRLQGMLRALGPEWHADAAAEDPSTAGALLLIAPDIYHTLGAFVLAGQLRRAGLTVRLMVGGAPDDVSDLVARVGFDVIMISASVADDLTRIAGLIQAARAAAERIPPVIIGGTILEQDMDIKAASGADFATSSLADALRFCNFLARDHSGPRAGT